MVCLFQYLTLQHQRLTALLGSALTQSTFMLNEFYHIIGIIGLFRMLIYALGDPHQNYNPQAILAFVTYRIALLRLTEVSVETPKLTDKPRTLSELDNNRSLMNYTVETAKQAGGWINAVGFCPICTSFWFMLVSVLPYYGIYWLGISLLLTKIVIKWT